jgi:hypothetical protein
VNQIMLQNNGLTGASNTLPDLTSANLLWRPTVAQYLLMKPKRKHKPVTERFWAKVDVRGPDQCWEWTGSVNEHGYGKLAIKSKVGAKAHRLSWEINCGPIPDGACVLHKCDNPPCVNPSHLFLGTKKDNTHDMRAKGRMVPPPTHYGEKHHNSKLSDAERLVVIHSNERVAALAERYGMAVGTIYQIRKRYRRD